MTTVFTSLSARRRTFLPLSRAAKSRRTMRRRAGRTILACGITLSAFGLRTANAQTYTYDNLPDNFSTGFSPALTTGSTTAVLAFGGTTYTATDDLTSAVTLNSLTFSNTGAVVLARGTGGATNLLTFDGTTPTVSLGNSGSLTIALDMLLNALTSFSGSGSATISGSISGNGGLTMGGTGTLTLSGTNSYIGGTTANSGTLVAGSTTAFGNGALALGGGAVWLNGKNLTVTSLSATSGTLLDNTTTASTLTVNQTGTTSFVGTASNGGSAILTIAKTNTGSLTLAGSADNVGTALSVSGGTLILGKTSTSGVHATGGGATISGGILQLAGTGGDQIYDGTGITLNSGTFDMNGHNESINTLVGSGGSVTNTLASSTSILNIGVSNGTSAGFAGTIVDTGSGGTAGKIALTKSGSGTVNLSGTNTYSGATTITGGALTLTTTGAFSPNTSGIAVSAGTLNLNPATSTTFNYAAIPLTLTGATLHFGNDLNTLKYQGGITLSGANTISEFGIGINATVSGIISGSGSLTLNGGAAATSHFGSITLSGANNYSGGTTITNTAQQFTVKLSGGANRLGNGNALTMTAFGSNGYGETLDLNGQAQTISTFTVNSATAGTYGALASTGGGGTLTLTSGAVGAFVVNNFNQSGGAITDPGYLQINGGTYTMSGGSLNIGGELLNSFSGTAGTLTIGNASVDAFQTRLANTGTGTINLNSGGTLLTDFVHDAGGTGILNFNGGTLGVSNKNAGGFASTWLSSITHAYILNGGATIDTANGSVTAVQALEAGAGSTGGLTKTGANTLTLSSTSNTYAGATTISGGTLKIAGDGSLGAVPGSPTANVTLSGGSLQFGATGTTLNVNRNIALSSAATIDTQANSDTIAGIISGSGALTTTGSGAGTLTLTNTNTYTAGTTVSGGTLALNAAGADGNGALSVASGAKVTVGADNALGSGNVTLTGATLENTAASTSQTGLGSLSLGAGGSTLDFGASNTSGIFNFSSAGATFTGTLNVLDWNGNPSTNSPAGGGPDQFFIGTTATSLTPAQLNQISFTNPNGIPGTFSAIQLATGEIVATDSTPEPGTVVLLLTGAASAGVGILSRRRKK
jgi:fibronectin-binding autotransporter adhesin